MRTSFWIQKGLWVALLAGFLGMGGCGGGGGAASQAENKLLAQYKSDLTEIPEQTVSQVTVTTESAAEGETLRITDLAGEFANLEVGQSVVLAPSEAQGMPLGFVGVVHSRDDTSVVLRDARVDEVFDKLSVDYDTARSAAFVSTVAPAGARLIAAAAASDYSGSINSSGSGINLTLQVNKPVGTSARLVGKIDLKDLRLSSEIDFDILEYPGSFGINRIRYEWTGQSAASLTLESVTDDGGPSTVAWGDLFPKLAGGNYRWDQPATEPIPGTRWLTGSTRYFSLSGLDKSDRAGLVPLGGVVLTPAGATTFVNQPSVLQQVSPIAFVLWLYIDAHGELKFVSDNKLLDAESGVWRSGMRIERGTDGLTFQQIKDYGSPKLSSHVTGALQAKQNLGAAIGADLIVGGIRPASGKIELFGAEFEGKLQSSRTAGIQWYPSLAMLLPTDQDFCASYAVSTYSEASYRMGIKLESPIPGLEQLSFGRQGSSDRKVWQTTGDFFAQNCPLEHVLTVTKIQKDAPVTRFDCGTGDPNRRCDLLCEVDETLQVGQEIKDIKGAFTVHALQRGGSGRFQLDSTDTDTLFKGTYGQQMVNDTVMGSFAVNNRFDPINTSMPPILYSSERATDFSALINRATADFDGTFKSSKTNGWNIDASTVTCEVQYGVKSKVAWLITP